MTSPFAFGDLTALRHIAEVLPQYLHPSDVQAVLDDVREHLHEGITTDLQQMHTVVRACRKCHDVVPSPTLPLWNVADPDVVFVAEAPWQGGPADTLFVDTLKATGFRSARVCRTSVVRCAPRAARPSADTVTTCSQSYLYREIQTLMPKLIVPLGAVATEALLGPDVKVSQVRGQQFWLGPWVVQPVMSPGYALQRDAHDEFRDDIARAYAYVYGQE